MRRQDKRKFELNILVAVLCSTPFVAWFVTHNDPGKAFAALAAVTVFFSMLGAYRELRRTVAFWIAAVIGALIQVMFLAIPWPSLASGRELKGIAGLIVFPDLLILWGLFTLAKKAATQNSQSQ